MKCHNRTRTVLQNEPDQILCYDNLVQSSNMRVQKLPVMMDFAGKIRITLVGRLEHYLMEY